MVLNADKFHFVCIGKNTKNDTSIFNNFIFSNSDEEKSLEITTDNRLT